MSFNVHLLHFAAAFDEKWSGLLRRNECGAEKRAFQPNFIIWLLSAAPNSGGAQCTQRHLEQARDLWQKKLYLL
jgi:hypothetical protein